MEKPLYLTSFEQLGLILWDLTKETNTLIGETFARETFARSKFRLNFFDKLSRIKESLNIFLDNFFKKR